MSSSQECTDNDIISDLEKDGIDKDSREGQMVLMCSMVFSLTRDPRIPTDRVQDVMELLFQLLRCDSYAKACHDIIKKRESPIPIEVRTAIMGLRADERMQEQWRRLHTLAEALVDEFPGGDRDQPQ